MLNRRFWGSWELESWYRRKWQAWMKDFFSLPLVYAHGLDPRGIGFKITDLKIQYDRQCPGDYTAFRSANSAYEQLARDCETLDDMARAYIALFRARLDWEAKHPPSSDEDEGSQTPVTILNVIGEADVRRILEDRMKRKGVR